MGSFITQMPTEPIGWSTAAHVEARPEPSPRIERTLALVTLLLWGFVLPLDLAVGSLLV